MDEEELERIREQLIQQLMDLELNADTDSDQTDSEDEDDLFEESLASEDWYYWPDKTAVDRLDGMNIGNGQQEADLHTTTEAILENDGDEDDEKHTIDPQEDDQEGILDFDDADTTTKKKKKKKKKKKGVPAADDDEFDVPRKELENAKDIYNPITLKVDERFRLAMENFRKERSFTSLSAQILATYFTFGGMDEHHDVRRDGSEIEATVDFVYIVSAFLSSYLLTMGGWHDSVYFRMAPKVVLAFLKYVLANRVLPEYEEQIQKALDIALMAKIEAPKCKTFNSMMPDDFNMACSILYVDMYTYDPLPDFSVELLERIAGIKMTSEVQLQSKQICYARVVRIETAPSDTSSLTALEAALEAITISASVADPKPDQGLESASAEQKLEHVSKANSEPVSDPGLELSSESASDLAPENTSPDLAPESPPASSSESASDTGPPLVSESDSESESIVYSTVVVEQLAIYNGVFKATEGLKREFSIQVPNGAAFLLQPGSILRGTFYTLSNNVVFARPLTSLSSFFVELDEDYHDL
ncbi:hypothetical protein BGX28_006999 [Mortierella sp. GBA30]|nr:hypothetical protein BGX28_006999 [Mortierella sp. GBA30]